MEVSRRDFIKVTGAGALTAAVLSSFTDKVVWATTREFPLKRKIKETATICCYCSVGCGAIVATYEDGTIKIEGDPDHPINEGALCSKGQAMSQIHQIDGKLNQYRLSKPLYRAPHTNDWEEKSWGWMIDTIAHRVKATRDEYWNDNAGRTDAIASLGGGELDNEECYLLSKINRALGIVYLEHCARI